MVIHITRDEVAEQYGVSNSTLKRHRKEVGNKLKLRKGDKKEVTNDQLRSVIDALDLHKRGPRPYLPEVENTILFLRNGYAADVGQGASRFETKQDALELIHHLAEAEPDERRKAHLQNAKATDRWYNQNKKRAAASAGVEIGDRKTSHLSLQRAAAASVEHGPCVRQVRARVSSTNSPSKAS